MPIYLMNCMQGGKKSFKGAKRAKFDYKCSKTMLSSLPYSFNLSRCSDLLSHF